MIESVLSSLFTLENLLWINVGLAGGIMVGALPGLTGTMAMALLLPLTPGSVRQAHQFQQLHNPLTRVALVPDGQRKGHVVKDIFTGHEIKILKNHAHLALQLTQAAAFQTGHLHAHDLHAALLVRLQTVEAAQQGRLARAGMPHDAEDFALVHAHVNIVQDLVRAVALTKTADLYHPSSAC